MGNVIDFRQAARDLITCVQDALKSKDDREFRDAVVAAQDEFDKVFEPDLLARLRALNQQALDTEKQLRGEVRSLQARLADALADQKAAEQELADFTRTYADAKHLQDRRAALLRMNEVLAANLKATIRAHEEITRHL